LPLILSLSPWTIWIVCAEMTIISLTLNEWTNRHFAQKSLMPD